MSKVHQLHVYGQSVLKVGDLLEVVEARGETVLVSVLEKVSPSVTSNLLTEVAPTTWEVEPPPLGVSVSDEIDSEESIG